MDRFSVNRPSEAFSQSWFHQQSLSVGILVHQSIPPTRRVGMNAINENELMWSHVQHLAREKALLAAWRPRRRMSGPILALGPGQCWQRTRLVEMKSYQSAATFCMDDAGKSFRSGLRTSKEGIILRDIEEQSSELLSRLRTRRSGPLQPKHPLSL